MEQPEQLDYHIYKDYQVIEKVGKGTYGVVYKARHKKTSKICAIKKIIDAFQNLIDAKRTYRELNYLLQTDHPCIVRLEYLLNLHRRGILNEPSTTRLAIPPYSLQQRGSTTDKIFMKFPQQSKHVYAVFEFMETDLSCALRKCSEMQPIQRKYIAYQLLHGIAYLHRSGLVHRDIKPSNILLDCNSLDVKICDFGMARLKIEKDSVNQGVLTEYVASRWYRPPQALLGITTCSDSIDLWSVGCVLAELVLKTPLFPGKSTIDQLQLIMRCIGMPSNKEIQKLSSTEAQYVLKNFSFSKRCKIKSLQETLSGCCNQEIDLIMSLLKFDPAMRMSAQEALRHEYFNEVRHMNEEMERCRGKVSKVMDCSTSGFYQENGNIGNPGIDHYRMLIDELEKYAERSTNRSGNTFNIPDKHDQIIEIPHNIQKNNENQQNFKEKSTKQSDFVTMNKHHYLNSTHSVKIQKEYPKQKQARQKTSTFGQEDKGKKMNKKKVISSKGDISQKNQMNETNGFKKQQKKESNKNQVKHRKVLTHIKSSQSFHKKKNIHRQASCKLIKQKRQFLNQSSKFLQIQPPSSSSKKKALDQRNKSLTSNKSSSSFHRPSKQKTTKSHFEMASKPKADHLKIFMKHVLNLNKSTIVKCKPKYPTQSRKKF